ncbi:TonB-dependent receptor [soil metagenome]|jgi:hypothetical protein
MGRILLLLVLGMLATTAFAQNHGIVKAIVMDSIDKKPVALATVSVLRLKDSSLISYTVTDKNGAFTLRNLREEPSRLLISHVGFESLRLSLKFKKDEPVDLGKLYLNVKTLKEVIIKGERVPVMIKKDTIEFDAEAFKTRPNALVEDLLRKLPGIQIDFDGHITVNGKEISKIKVNGKNFFINDPTIATKSLEANMISKVQVYDDHEDDPDHLIPDYKVKKIINLKFKKSFKKGALSTIGVGAGTQDRYAATGFYSNFQGEKQVAVKVGSDNLSSTGSFLGSYGGFQSYSFGSDGIKKSNNGSTTFSNTYKNFKLNAEYRFEDNIRDNNSAVKRQQTISDTIFNTLSTNMQHQRMNSQSLHMETEWKPDTLTIIKYTPDLNYNYNNNKTESSGSTINNFIPLLNTTVNSSHGSNNSFQYQHSFNYYRRLTKKGASLNIGNSVNIHPENGLNFTANDLVSYVSALRSDTLRRSVKTTNTVVNVSLSGAYHYSIGEKLSADIAVSGLHEVNKGDLLTYNEDLKTGLYSIFLPDQSSNLIRKQWQQTASPFLTYKFSDFISIKAGFASQLQQINNHFNSYTGDLNQRFFYLLPSAELHLNHLNLSYAEEVQQPAINDLQPITVVYSPLFSFTGNPGLKPTHLHHIRLNYQDYLPQSGLNFYLNSSVTVETNSILRARTVTAEGAEVTTPINRNGRFTATLSGQVSKSKKLNKWQLTSSSNINAAMGHNFFEVNNQNGYQNTKNIILTQTFYANYNDVFELQPSYNINYAITKYQLVNYQPTNYTTQHAGMGLKVFLPQKFTWNADYNYSYNPLVAPGFRRSSNALNVSIIRRVQKNDRGEISLICYDLLNQSVSSVHYAQENTINDIQNQLLKRYFLLAYTYHFKAFKN